MVREIFTIGHSNTEPVDFFKRLKQFDIQVVVDVRSQPYSQYVRAFDKESLESLCKKNGVKYLFLGKLLGGKPQDESVTDQQKKTGYHLLVEKDYFQSGINKLLELSKEQRVCVMCSEGGPEKCHRSKLIGPVLEEKGVRVMHILPDGAALDSEELQRKIDQGQLTLF